VGRSRFRPSEPRSRRVAGDAPETDDGRSLRPPVGPRAVSRAQVRDQRGVPLGVGRWRTRTTGGIERIVCRIGFGPMLVCSLYWRDKRRSRLFGDRRTIGNWPERSVGRRPVRLGRSGRRRRGRGPIRRLSRGRRVVRCCHRVVWVVAAVVW